MSAPLVIVGLSGGVDSAVAARLLLDAGCRVEGLHMVNWEAEDAYCTRVSDEAEAAAVAAHLGIELHRANFAADYRERVFRDFLAEIRAGRTPNPDVPCNREVKFGAFLNWARRLGADFIATGHYARRADRGDAPALLTARDRSKDQTYFLHSIRGAALAHTLFPVGDLLKSDVRALARRAGLPNHARPDSTGICFIGERPFRSFIREYIPDEPGPIEDAAGRVLGEHRGIHLYTLGQRAGLGIGGRAGTREAPWYVVAKQPKTRSLVVSQDPQHPLLLIRSLDADRSSWISGRAPPAGITVAVRVRHRQSPVHATLHAAGRRLRLSFRRPVRAVTPGQYAVVYAGDVCLGGGRIVRCHSLAEGISARHLAAGARA